MSGEMRRDGQEGLPLVAFDYIKSQFFRVIHVDGAIGGSAPNGSLHLSLFSERAPIPRREAHRLKQDGSLGELVPGETKIRDAIIREVDVDLVMSVETAEVLAEWLGQRVREIKRNASIQRQVGEDR